MYNLTALVASEINDIETSNYEFSTILESSKSLGLKISRFCYHESLSLSGNCRICLFEADESDKPLVSCLTEIEDDMKAWMDSIFSWKSREGVMEFLLTNHPLDCPICEQAGECDLQNYSYVTGSDRSRRFFVWKSSEDKYFGILIKTSMSRCIHCTRCVRFYSEIIKKKTLGTLIWGSKMEIGVYLTEQELEYLSLLSGNVLDVCPVGALGSNSNNFKDWPWKLKTIESIDLFDNFGGNVFVEYKHEKSDILAVTPWPNLTLNQNLISDKMRFSFDANVRNRIQMIWKKKFNPLNKTFFLDNSGWEEFFIEVKNFCLKNDWVIFLIDSKTDFITQTLLKKLINLKFFWKCIVRRVDRNFSEYSNISFYRTWKESIEDLFVTYNPLIISLSTNFKLEACILNAWIKKKQKNFQMIWNQIFDHEEIEDKMENKKISEGFFIEVYSVMDWLKIFQGKSKLSKRILENHTVFFWGNVFYSRYPLIESFIDVLNIKLRLNIKSNIISHMSNKDASSIIHLKSINSKIFKFSKKNIKNFLIVSLDLDPKSIIFKKYILSKKEPNVKIACMATHNFKLMGKMDFILIGLTKFEYRGITLNLEHRPQFFNKINPYATNVMSPHAFINNIIKLSTSNHAFDKLVKIEKTQLSKQYRYIEELCEKPYLYGTLEPRMSYQLLIKNKLISCISFCKKYPFKFNTKKYYVTEEFLRNSIVMKACTDTILQRYKISAVGLKSESKEEKNN